ncbi:MAG: GH92 family glycosyl hydrolase [Clostridia bacterium]|nr:GH92 family glycosyl hydrolase [Clostridia bacterium]
MWPLIRILVSMFIVLETTFAGLFNGLMIKSVEMPEIETGEYTQYVDPFIGTGGTPWTAGMLSPAATVPFGSVRLGPDTSFIGGAYIVKTNTSGYYYEHAHIKGFSHSRLSGTGAEDYQMFRITPAVGEKEAGIIPYSHLYEKAVPGYYAVYLQSLDCLVELSADIHTGVHRYTFNNSQDARLYIDITSTAGNYNAAKGFVNVDEENAVITGGCELGAAFSSRYEGLPVYFAAIADKEIKSYEIVGDENDLGIDINFGNINGEPVEMKVGISFVSTENAYENLISETEGLTFDDVRKNALSDWDGALSVIDMESTDNEIKKVFYTALYHSMIMPTNFTDVNGEYLGFDKEVHTADGFTYRTDMSLWDTARTTHSLYTLIAPEIQYDCLKSLVEMAEVGGALPRWPMGAGYAGSMLGDPANIVITESYLKGFTDFDVQTAYEYMKHSSEVKDTKVGRDYVDLYNKYGYVPDDLAPADESVARTIEYSWEDGAIATLAEALGYTQDAAKYYEKSMNYKNTFNPATKYFQARNSDGKYVWNFSPYITSFYDAVMIKKFADAYCEGSARQWRWNALQDIDGMIELFGSEEYFVKELEDFMEDASLTRAAIDPGHGFWVGNQHDIHTPYLFSNAGREDLTQKWVRWTLAERFSSDINGLDGNDDGGTLSSWYVFSAMGFYPLAGTDKYWIGSPNIDSATVTLGNGNTLDIKAVNQSEKNVYVKSVTLNGVELEGTYITHEELMSGGELVFTMGSTPNK